MPKFWGNDACTQGQRPNIPDTSIKEGGDGVGASVSPSVQAFIKNKARKGLAVPAPNNLNGGLRIPYLNQQCPLE